MEHKYYFLNYNFDSQKIWLPSHFVLRHFTLLLQRWTRCVLSFNTQARGELRRQICVACVSCCCPSLFRLLFLCKVGPAHCGSCLLTGWPLTSCWNETWIQLLLKTVGCLSEKPIRTEPHKCKLYPPPALQSEKTSTKVTKSWAVSWPRSEVQTWTVLIRNVSRLHAR